MTRYYCSYLTRTVIIPQSEVGLRRPESWGKLTTPTGLNWQLRALLTDISGRSNYVVQRVIQLVHVRFQYYRDYGISWTFWKIKNKICNSTRSFITRTNLTGGLHVHFLLDTRLINVCISSRLVIQYRWSRYVGVIIFYFVPQILSKFRALV